VCPWRPSLLTGLDNGRNTWLQLAGVFALLRSHWRPCGGRALVEEFFSILLEQNHDEEHHQPQEIAGQDIPEIMLANGEGGA
jgi:hypothetical protein